MKVSIQTYGAMVGVLSVGGARFDLPPFLNTSGSPPDLFKMYVRTSRIYSSHHIVTHGAMVGVLSVGGARSPSSIAASRRSYSSYCWVSRSERSILFMPMGLLEGAARTLEAAKRATTETKMVEEYMMTAINVEWMKISKRDEDEEVLVIIKGNSKVYRPAVREKTKGGRSEVWGGPRGELGRSSHGL